MSRVGCATCGAEPVGTFNDGSPRFGCGPHPPVRGADGSVDERVIVVLEPFELEEAAKCGKLRLTRANRRKARDQLGDPSLFSHVVGAQGERAFTKWLSVPWDCTTGRYGGASDVRGCQIRTVTTTGKRLVVHDTDPAGIPVILIVAHEPRFWIRGWIFAREARRPEWRDDPGDRRPGWFVPPFELRPMATLLTNDPARAAMGLPPMAIAG